MAEVQLSGEARDWTVKKIEEATVLLRSPGYSSLHFGGEHQVK